MIREELIKIEHMTLSKYASFSDKTLGRDTPGPDTDYRLDYTRDRDRIIHCKAFRRLKHKTQVFMIPEGDHYRTRLTHTLEVSQIARTISKALHLNEDLTEAIALGHDLGHTPFGHCGEAVLNDILPNGFEHCKQSLRVVELLERHGKGLNLTKEVRDGILNHRTSGKPFTMEGKVVRISDKIAYINHDVDDAISAKLIKEEDLPIDIREALGMDVRERINTLISDIIDQSHNKPEIIQSEKIKDAMNNLRKWLFANLYKNTKATSEESKAQDLVYKLYDYFFKNPEKLTEEYKNLIARGESKEQVVADYIAGMTDDYAIFTFEKLFVPVGWKIQYAMSE